jgi:hypothetical protein
VVATEEYRSIVFQEPRFVEYFRLVSTSSSCDFWNIFSDDSIWQYANVNCYCLLHSFQH